MSGKISYLAGEAAEQQVAAHYIARGMSIAARRWRGKGGEIDLVAQDGDGLVFIEVKKSRSHARAAERLSIRQINRLFDAAGEYMAASGNEGLVNARFDVALVDGVGRIEIIENALVT
ncbi:MAG: YraN family protein [Pararhodobacter sp.]|nr:YraN family protein [Pararhodobacter sp.]